MQRSHTPRMPKRPAVSTVSGDVYALSWWKKEQKVESRYQQSLGLNEMVA